jgi:inorganic pyrophosphatase
MAAWLEFRSARTQAGLINIVIDTPKGSRRKFKYNPDVQAFCLSHILPAGLAFPFDFGFIPKTLGEDGDPLDVLLLGDAPTFAGCIATGKLIGALLGEQSEHGRTFRNDRLLASPVTAVNPPEFARLKDVPESWLSELEHFFVCYNEAHGRRYLPLGRADPATAEQTLIEAERRYLRSKME